MKQPTRFFIDPYLESYGLKVLKEKGGHLRLEGIRYVDTKNIRIFWWDEDNKRLESMLVPPMIEVINNKNERNKTIKKRKQSKTRKNAGE